MRALIVVSVILAALLVASMMREEKTAEKLEATQTKLSASLLDNMQLTAQLHLCKEITHELRTGKRD